jgi:hypothetical protein
MRRLLLALCSNLVALFMRQCCCFFILWSVFAFAFVVAFPQAAMG